MAEADISLAKPKAKPAPKKPAAEKKVTSKPFASFDDIKLGMKVRDPASGLTGLAHFKAELISGTVQYAIQPVGDGKSIPEGHFIDDFMLEFVDDGVSKKTPLPDPAAKFALGAELEDTITGFKGIAVERTTYLNGCVHYTLQPPNRQKGFIGKLLSEPSKAVHFDYKRLKKIGDGVAGPPPRKFEAEQKAPGFQRSSTGGPTRSMREAGHR